MHNTHHVTTNSIEADPDIQHLPVAPCFLQWLGDFLGQVMALDRRMLAGFVSTCHGKIFPPLVLDPLARLLVGQQEWLYYPVMAVARINLYLQSIKMLLDPRGEPVERRPVQLAAMGLFFSGLLYLVSHCHGVTESVAYISLAHAVSGLLHVQITVSHFAMHIWSADAVANSPPTSWLRAQLATTMNVACHPMLDWLHGGLQFQVEHHLFPRMPRHNLRFASARVRRLCAEHGIPYHVHTFWQANRMVLARLREVSTEARGLTMDSTTRERARAVLAEMFHSAVRG
jgi:delta8-fatty-acid desaturase